MRCAMSSLKHGGKKALPFPLTFGRITIATFGLIAPGLVNKFTLRYIKG